MAKPVIRAMAFYWKDKKAATVNQTSVKIKSGRSALMGAEGLLAFSRGAVMFDIDIDEVVPVSGSTTVDDIAAILNQEDVDVAVTLGGKIFRVTMAVISADYQSDTETGKCTGKITLSGGKPSVT